MLHQSLPSAPDLGRLDMGHVDRERRACLLEILRDDHRVQFGFKGLFRLLENFLCQDVAMPDDDQLGWIRLGALWMGWVLMEP